MNEEQQERFNKGLPWAMLFNLIMAFPIAHLTQGNMPALFVLAIGTGLCVGRIHVLYAKTGELPWKW